MNILVVMLTTLFLSGPSTATEVPVLCSDAIKQAEKIIKKNGANTASGNAAFLAAEQCMAGALPDYHPIYEMLTKKCDQSYQALPGTMYYAMRGVCYMNAARYIDSLNQEAE